MLRIPTQAPISALRNFLFDAGYQASRLISELGLKDNLHANLGNLPPLLERTSADAMLPTLARLFFVGWPTSVVLCRKYIPDPILQLCRDAGVLELEGDELLPAVIITPFENTLLFASDAPRLRVANPNVVLGPSGTTRLLGRAILRTHRDSLLDIGTGSGVLSVLAAGFSNRVLGTDVNERAIEFARFNAALNGVDNADFMVGDAFAPAEGKQFAQILANPPFFLTASKRLVFSDSPLELDGFTRKLAMEAPRYLADDGIFQMICEWVQIHGEPWEDRLRAWTEASGCDVFVLLGPKVNPLDYAEWRSQEAGSLYAGPTQHLMSERLNYLRQHQVEYVLSGVITMHKRKGANWFVSTAADLTHQDCGPAIRERMESLTFLAEQKEADWLNCRLRLAPDTTIMQAQALGEKGWAVTRVEISKPNFISAELKIDLPVLQAIQMFDGNSTLAQIIEKLQTSFALPYEEAKARGIGLAKRLVQSSFVLPA
jgi:predicted RNA methylase